MKVLRRAAWLALAGISLMAPGQVFAAAEIHRLNLVLSSNPTSLRAEDLNEFLADFNSTRLQPKGLEPLEQFGFTFLNEAELRYFVRPNVSVTAGFGQIRATSKREYLPRLAQRIELRTEVVAVPLQLGATYYLAPYNQGDFQARAFIGGGLVTVTQGKVMFEQLEFATDSATTLNPDGEPGSTRYKGRGDGPGYFFEAGGHMFFASRFSVMIGGYYRSAHVRNLRITQDIINSDVETIGQVPVYGDDTLDLDVGGMGLKLAVAIGF